jgi:hypothetical protein
MSDLRRPLVALRPIDLSEVGQERCEMIGRRLWQAIQDADDAGDDEGIRDAFGHALNAAFCQGFRVAYAEVRDAASEVGIEIPMAIGMFSVPEGWEAEFR